MNIHAIEVSNFRVFKELTRFEIRPITILTGINSSGKSSFIRLIKLMEENRKNILSELNFPATINGIGVLEENLNNELGLAQPLQLNVEFTLLPKDKEIALEFKSQFIPENEYRIELTYSPSQQNNLLLDKMELKTLKGTTIFSFDGTSYGRLDIHLYNIIELLNENIEHSLFSNSSIRKRTDYLQEIGKGLKQGFVNQDMLADKNITVGETSLASNSAVWLPRISLWFSDQFPENIYDAKSSFTDKLSRFLQLNVKQSFPEELTEYLSADKDPNFEEFFTAEIVSFLYKDILYLLDYSITRISNLNYEFHDPQRLSQKRFFSSSDNDFKRLRFLSSGENKDFINKWINDFGIGDKVIIRELYQSLAFVVEVTSNGKTINLADMGFGFSQILPMLVAFSDEIIHDKTKWYEDVSTFVLEEPESNLHPALQSKLADFFVEAIDKNQVNFLIETHSEYLIRKLQYHVAKGLISKDKIAIYYVNKGSDFEPGFSKVDQILVNDDGSLSADFGKGFFDEADNIALELFMLKVTQKN